MSVEQQGAGRWRSEELEGGAARSSEEPEGGAVRSSEEPEGGAMALNDTQPILDVLQSVHLGDLVLAFCLSVLVGLVLGALVYVLLTWASRRRATANITRRSRKRTDNHQAQESSGGQLGLYRSTFLSVYRQPSVEPVGPLGAKPGAETSTFRPVARRCPPGLDLGGDTRVEEASVSDSTSLVPNKRHSFWLGGNGLKGFLPSQAPPQAPPPAYDSVIHAFQETPA